MSARRVERVPLSGRTVGRSSTGPQSARDQPRARPQSARAPPPSAPAQFASSQSLSARDAHARPSSTRSPRRAPRPPLGAARSNALASTGGARSPNPLHEPNRREPPGSYRAGPAGAGFNDENARSTEQQKRDRLFTKSAGPRASRDADDGGGATVGHIAPDLSHAVAGVAAKSQEDLADELARVRAARAARGASDSPRRGATPWARPRPSEKAPLKSCFLDTEVNNLPKSKTFTELRRKKRYMDMPHASYDIDGDGIVSQEDMFLAKRFDLDGNGVLDADEQAMGKRVIADEFFKAHEHELGSGLYGDEWKALTARGAAEKLVKSHHFNKQLRDLKRAERAVYTRGSHQMTDALTLKKDLTRHNFFANKFDSSAWNDFGANPRPKDFNSRIGAAPYVIEQGGIEHRGSWHAWHDLKKTKDRLYCQQKLDAADAKSQVAYWQNRGGFRRVSMITENRGQL